MSTKTAPKISTFGQLLRMWRSKKRLSQLDLSLLAATTPRYMSFIETGRARPGADLVMRLARALQLSVRDSNALLAAAGLAPAYPDRDFEDIESEPYRLAIDRILERHDPYPACAFDASRQVVACNDGFRAFSPGVENRTPEESIDAFLAPGPAREMFENWAELAWAWLDQQTLKTAMSNNKKDTELLARGRKYLESTPRPTMSESNPANELSPRLRIGDKIIGTFVTIMRFESVREVTMSELRIELIFPLDAVGEAHFTQVYADYQANKADGDA